MQASVPLNVYNVNINVNVNVNNDIGFVPCGGKLAKRPHCSFA